jgi:hypothetical protein
MTRADFWATTAFVAAIVAPTALAVHLGLGFARSLSNSCVEWAPGRITSFVVHPDGTTTTTYRAKCVGRVNHD